MTREEAEAVEMACEMYARLHKGQFGMLAEALCISPHFTREMQGGYANEYEKNKGLCDAVYRKDLMKDLMNTLYKKLVGSLSNEEMREAYRAEVVWLAIRNGLKRHDDREKDMSAYWYDSPLNRSDQPTPDVEVTEGAE